jgi:hypothetical protein
VPILELDDLARVVHDAHARTVRTGYLDEPSALGSRRALGAHDEVRRPSPRPPHTAPDPRLGALAVDLDEVHGADTERAQKLVERGRLDGLLRDLLAVGRRTVADE